MANYFCETYLMISNLLYGTSTLASPRVPPMIGFAFLQLACVYLLQTAVTSSTSLLWMHSLACSRHSYSTQGMIATQKGKSWRLGNCEEELPKKPVGRQLAVCRPTGFA